MEGRKQDLKRNLVEKKTIPKWEEITPKASFFLTKAIFPLYKSYDYDLAILSQENYKFREGEKMHISQEEKMAETLVRLAKTKFYAGRGKYRIPRAYFLALTGIKTLNDPFLRKIQAITHGKGYILVDLGDEFAVLRESSIKKIKRQVPQKIFKEFMRKLHPEEEEEKSSAKAKKKKAKEEEE